jgi:hypothetical protein
MVLVLACPVGLSLLAAPYAHAGDLSARRCTITGTPGPDIIWGTPGRDVICGQGGRDIIFGAGGGDVIRGGPGADIIVAGVGTDVISGGAGNDIVLGGPGDDDIRGGSGVNVVSAVSSTSSPGHGHDLPSGRGLDAVAADLRQPIRRMSRVVSYVPPELKSIRMYSGAAKGPMLAAAHAWEKLTDRLGVVASAPSTSPGLGKGGAKDLETVLTAAISASKAHYDLLVAGSSEAGVATR